MKEKIQVKGNLYKHMYDSSPTGKKMNSQISTLRKIAIVLGVLCLIMGIITIFF